MILMKISRFNPIDIKENDTNFTGSSKIFPNELNRQVYYIPINDLLPFEFQPRRNFDITYLNELTESIRVKGVLQPIWVRKKSDSIYEIIAGERRWRAAKEAGLTEIPSLIYEVDIKAAMAMALIENIQRCDLSPIDEAIAFKNLIEQHQISHQELATLVSKSRSTITNTLRLLNLEENVQKLLNEGQIEMGHAKVLLGVSAEEQYTMAHLIVQKRLSVRELEILIKNKTKTAEDLETIVALPQQTKINALTELLSGKLSFPFKFKAAAKGQGAFLTIKFKNTTQASQFVENFKIEG